MKHVQYFKISDAISRKFENSESQTAKRRMRKLIIYTDGGARGNPGPAGIGAVFYNEKRELVKKHNGYIGEKTNNEAEYSAVIEALKAAKKLGAGRLEIFMDSELVQRQLNGIYKVKQAHLQELLREARNLEQNFEKVSYNSIPREKNKTADRLVNLAIDRALKKEV